MNKQNQKKNNYTKLMIIAVAAAAVLFVTFKLVPGQSEDGNTGRSGNRSEVVKDNDIVIPVSEITETAKYYPANINGTELEVMAVKAPDGTVRTAFNTCQVCYSSGRGYYVQEGNALICQNCGNRFAMDDVEVTRGGCNPVPITEEYKTVDDETITVSKDFLAEATVIFQNWK